MQLRLAKYVILIIFLLFSGDVIADHSKELKQEEPVRMPEIVVVASPIIEGNQTNQFGAQVSVIQKKQIEDLNAQDLPSALRRTPGVVISRYNQVGSFGGGDGGAVYIRGMGSSRPGAEIQMLVDGIPKYAGVWTHPLMDIMSVDIADKIEVYKGAQPILFGNMAFGAVNIVTKRRKEEGFTTSISAAAGSYNTFIETFEHGCKIKDTDYYIVQSFKQSSGHRENAGGELQDYFARIGYQLSGNWSMSFTANATHNYADDPGPEERPQERQGSYKAEDTMTILSVSHKYEKAKGEIKAYWNGGKGSWVNQYDLAGLFHFDTITKYDNYGVRWRETLNPWQGGSITTGADFDFTSGTVFIDREALRPDSNFARDAFRMVSPNLSFGQEVALGSSWQLIPSAGVRYYNHSDFDSRFAPQAGLVLKDQSTNVHFFYSRGINYPGLYVVAQSNLFWGNNTQWKNLDPETVDHFEGGISHSFGPKIRGDVTLFHDKGSNRLIIITSPAPTHYENIATFETQGVEATLTFQPIKEMSFFAGGTWMINRSPDNLPYSPQWTASAGANLRLLNHLKINIDSLYQDSQYVANTRSLNYGGSSIVHIDGFFLLNGKISWEFDWSKHKLTGEIFLAGENITNVSYAYRKDYPMPGINGMVGINLKF